MNTEDYFVRVMDLPHGVKGVVTPNSDGTFSIFLNARYDDATQRRTLEHELRHIASDHFSRADEALKTLEAEAEGLVVHTDGAVRTIPLYRSMENLRHYLQHEGVLEDAIG